MVYLCKGVGVGLAGRSQIRAVCGHVCTMLSLNVQGFFLFFLTAHTSEYTDFGS